MTDTVQTPPIISPDIPQNHIFRPTSETIIDLSADPFIPSGWNIEPGDHERQGQLEWRRDNLFLWLSREQRNRAEGSHRTVQTPKLRMILEMKKERDKEERPYNACLCDFFLDHPEEFPREVMAESPGVTTIVFLATIYTGAGGAKYARALTWNERRSRWCGDQKCLESTEVWRKHEAVAVYRWIRSVA